MTLQGRVAGRATCEVVELSALTVCLVVCEDGPRVLAAIWFDPIKVELFIVHIKGSQVKNFILP